MSLAPKLDAASAANNLDEIKPPYTPQEALVEANRCLFCFDAPCIMSCPTGIDIPSFIKKIATDNVTGSARVILTANILGASCARVCPTEVLCEGSCVMLDKEKDPIKIGRLQRYATDHVFNNNIRLFKPKDEKEKNGKKIAVIGAGPAGLGCAAELVQMGYDVTIFEKREKGGGLNTFGIAYYKMKPEVSLEEVELVESLGVTIRYRTEIGKDITVEKLEKDFDAIFLGVGLGDTQRLGIPGENAKGVVDALEFIEQIHTHPLHEVPVGDRVAVVGCGNTAIDASTQSKRLGASNVFVIYRRGEKDMPAYDFEYELAKSDGVEFLFNTLPLEVLTDAQGNVRGMKMAKTRVAAGKVEIIPGSEYEEAFDMIIPAVGQEKQKNWIQKVFPKLEIDKKGVIINDPQTKQTSEKKIFCGGDCANGGREVVNAVGEGKKAALGIHNFLLGEVVDSEVQPSRHGLKEGRPTGSGLRNPVRAPELEAAYFSKNGNNNGHKKA